MARRRLLPGADARQGLVALALNSSTSLVAGAMLGSLTATFERRPGLLVLIPAAIGLRGNVFGSLGNRVSTSIHAGRAPAAAPTIDHPRSERAGGRRPHAGHVPRPRPARRAWCRSGSGSARPIGLADLALVSVGGGALASLPVLAATLGLAAGAVRFGWDLDNVTAPLVSTLGDVLTLPALYLATGLLGSRPRHLDPRLGPRRARRGGAGGRCPLVAAPAPPHRAHVDPCAADRGLVSSLAGRGPRAPSHDLQRPARPPHPRARPPLQLPAPSAASCPAACRASCSSAWHRPTAAAVPRAPAVTSGSSPGSACRCSSRTVSAPTSWRGCSAWPLPGSVSSSPPPCSPASPPCWSSRSSPTTARSSRSASGSTPTPTGSRWSAPPSTSSAPSASSSPSRPSGLA